MPQQRPITIDDIRQAASVIGALDSPLRMHILVLLNQRNHVVHELVSELQKSQPLISQHLRVLKKVGLVSSERTGREVVYSLAVPESITLIRAAADIAQENPLLDELAQRRATHSTEARVNEQADTDTMEPQGFDDGSGNVGAAAIVGVPTDTQPDVDPGLLPKMPRPQK